MTDYDTNEDFPEKDSEDEDLEQGSDGEHPVAAWHGDVQYNGPAEQTANATHAVRDGAYPSPRARAKRNGKAKAQPESPNETSVSGIAQKGQRLEWSPKESTVLVAARWFTKDELQQMTGKQGSQVHETATMAVAQLLSDTLKQCSADGVAQITGVIREWMATQQSQTSRPLHFSGSRHGDDDSWHYNREGSEGNTNADLSDGVEEWRRGDDA
ncbi:unnamed protein product [Closterium sp. NIES-65]|nr:unnamed protein product [Closterium sp. NIES-65]